MRNVSRPTRFIAFTDDPSGLDSGVEARPIPPIKLPATGLGLSPWRKLALWSRDIGVEGDVLFMDLDVVVVGPLDELIRLSPGRTRNHPRLGRQRLRQLFGDALSRRRRAPSRRSVRGAR